MNREIKFRAWDRENKKMIYDFANFSSGNVIDVPEGRWSHELRLTNKNEIKASLNFKSNDTFETKRIENIPTMQFTGLKDKNVVDIFEGDIIQSTWYDVGNNPYKKKGEVTFVGAQYVIAYDSQFDVETGEIKYDAHSLTYAEDAEVIGNIYENPELLEVEV